MIRKSYSIEWLLTSKCFSGYIDCRFGQPVKIFRQMAKIFSLNVHKWRKRIFFTTKFRLNKFLWTRWVKIWRANRKFLKKGQNFSVNVGKMDFRFAKNYLSQNGRVECRFGMTFENFWKMSKNFSFSVRK